MTKKQQKTFKRIVTAAVLWIAVNILVTHFMPLLTESLGMSEIPWLVTALEAALFLAVYFIIGYDILRKAVLGIWHGEVFDENFLMAVATVGAVALGDYSESVAVMLFYQIGELFQAVAVGKSRRNITALMDICPDYANIEDEDGNLEQVDPEDVEIGTLIFVLPGEKVPIDGMVEEGKSVLNTAALTGESMPKEIGHGEMILSGCINMTGLLKVRTTKEFGESTVSKILDLVENASMKKSRCENFITRFAKYYTPAVCYCALALALLPPVWNILMGNPAAWSIWVTRALTFLVISCPCALVISIPLSFFAGIGAASARGILVKGSNYLEALSKTKYVVFDKTGTLTQGVFRVTKIQPCRNLMPEENVSDITQSCKLLEYAAYAEVFSNHPISRSLVEAYGKEMDHSKVEDVEEVSGHGVCACVDGSAVAVGNEKWMKKLGIAITDNEETAGTIVHVAVDGMYAGYLLIADVEKESAKRAVAALKAAGVKKTVMLTGDHRIVAEQVAQKLGIDAVYSELLPADKVDRVEGLLQEKAKGEMVAFVGDGINDAPVLSRADIGIAMGAFGSDAAIEAADIVLMDDNPMRISLAMAISRKTMGIVYQNIIFALGVKGFCLLLGAMGIANMWMAIFADVGVMVLAVLNAIRCLRIREEK